MTALADDLVSSKIKKDKTLFSRFGTPPRQRAPREQQRTYPTPPCEDGVDPFATTASAANDETTATTAYEDGQLTGMVNGSDDDYLDREVC
ncbi:hypothetical protein V502_10714 [Pseudogymnoascus sp. VKM F-4520 (FW-2644)]|nr:hypothetical protein V502_10714 [Pseudogymnoascus sp. VKM F-4520 (FW-2644)]